LAKLAANSDFITEAITESVEDKKELFNKLDALCPPHAIIASNTSSLLLSEFGVGVKRQDKIAVTHYLLPPHILPGVEIAKGPGTSEETFKITYDLMKKIRKVPIRVLKERPGYLLNRIVFGMRREAYRLWAEGVATAEDIDLGIRTTFGLRLPHDGALMNYDLSGIWRWPEDVRLVWSKLITDETPLSAEVIDKIKQRMREGSPWFIDPGKFDEVTENMNRKYLHGLKEWYWSKEN
jgi:3-hydroxyacyl-CoA dehydrogenase